MIREMRKDICTEPELMEGDRLTGFHVLKVEPLHDMRITAYEMEHEATGARILHLHCEDRENLYAIVFRTPPADSTGAAHILEHAVLAGSEKYPVKDAFNELSRGTLQTFINAFTYPDKTVYPAASQVKKDFFNLARVYTDLVLRPRLLKETFFQEGHHLEFEDPADENSPLTLSGIVYNEMKGAYSSPDSLAWKALQEALYPDTVYVFDSGGNPDVIPFLTYERLRSFHRTYYSPSNARFLIYGDIPPREHLAFLEEMLRGFRPVPVDSRIEKQRRWNEPVRTRDFYPIGKEENPAGKTTVNLAWMVADHLDPENALLIQIVSHALLGSAAGPLRRALIDSGMGEDLSPASGLETDLRQMAFVAGLRGTEPGRAEKIEALIIKTLNNVADKDFEREIIEGALHQLEFSGREIVRKRYPYGVSLLSKVYRTWLYDGDPLIGLRFVERIEKIRSRWTKEAGLFREIVKKWFVDNPHRVLSVMEPSRTFLEERDEAFRSMMAAARAGLSERAKREIRQETEALRRFQNEADSPEARACLPRLKKDDIPRRIEKLPTEKKRVSGVTVLKHDIFSNGIAYLQLVFDIGHVTDHLQPYLGLLGKLTTGMGAAGMEYGEMAKRIALKTGGIDYRLLSGMTVDGRECRQAFVMTVRALHRNVAEAIGLMEDMVCEGDLDDEERMRDLLLELKNGLHASVVPSGHLFAARTAASGLSLHGRREEQWCGRTQLGLLSRLSDGFQQEKTFLQETLQNLRKEVFTRGRLLVNVTAEESVQVAMLEKLGALIERLPEVEGTAASVHPEQMPSRTGVAIPAQVCYVAKVFPAPVYSSSDAAPIMVLSRLLSGGYLYQRIRVQGGAYGGMSIYDPLGGHLSFLSYRDPHLAKTLQIYEQVLSNLLKEGISEEDLEKAVIGTIGTLDRPMDPEAKGTTAMIRECVGLSDEGRQAFRDAVLGTTVQSIREAAETWLEKSHERSAVCAYASEENLRRANETLDTALTILPLI
jgi:Zn-dependent M16 (insulinase) family peptidase